MISLKMYVTTLKSLRVLQQEGECINVLFLFTKRWANCSLIKQMIMYNGREKVGYMVCCQQSMNRFGNRRFQNQAVDYMEEDILQKIVNDMHSELLVLTSSKNFSGRCLVRTFAHKTNPSLKLEISASLLRHQPAVSLLVSRTRPFEQGTRS